MLTCKEILPIVDGKTDYCGRDFMVKQITIDSRRCSPGKAFIAIRGHNFDGHQFIQKAVAAGATLIIASRSVKNCSVPVIYVKDTVHALGRIAAYHRQRFDIPVIAITGSVGKTTTKDLIHSVLRGQFRCAVSDKSFNNHIGVPLTLLKLTHKHQVAVLEMGTNQKGDIAYLAEMVQPTIAIFTAFGESHLEGLKNRNGVAREKLTLCDFMKRKGIIIYNRDDAFLSEKIKAIKGFKKVACSVAGEAAARAQKVRNTLQNRVLLTYRKREYAIRGISLHNAISAIIAVSCGELFNISYNNINKGLLKFTPSSGRMNLIRHNRYFIIDDTYNANPLSTKAAIDSLSMLPVKAERFLVLGDMAELGHKAERLHRDIGLYLKNCPAITRVLTIGSLSAHISQYLKKYKDQTRHFKTSRALVKFLRSQLGPGDAVLVKGSRSAHMEYIVQQLVK